MKTKYIAVKIFNEDKIYRRQDFFTKKRAANVSRARIFHKQMRHRQNL